MPEHFTARNADLSSPFETEEEKEFPEEEKKESGPRTLLCESNGLVYD